MALPKNATKQVQVKFDINYSNETIEEPYNLAVIGSLDALGKWDAETCLVAKEQEEGCGRWQVVMDLNKHNMFQWRWVVVSKESPIKILAQEPNIRNATVGHYSCSYNVPSWSQSEEVLVDFDNKTTVETSNDAIALAKSECNEKDSLPDKENSAIGQPRNPRKGQAPKVAAKPRKKSCEQNIEKQSQSLYDLAAGTEANTKVSKSLTSDAYQGHANKDEKTDDDTTNVTIKNNEYATETKVYENVEQTNSPPDIIMTGEDNKDETEENIDSSCHIEPSISSPVFDMTETGNENVNESTFDANSEVEQENMSPDIDLAVIENKNKPDCNLQDSVKVDDPNPCPKINVTETENKSVVDSNSDNTFNIVKAQPFSDISVETSEEINITTETSISEESATTILQNEPTEKLSKSKKRKNKKHKKNLSNQSVNSSEVNLDNENKTTSVANKVTGCDSEPLVGSHSFIKSPPVSEKAQMDTELIEFAHDTQMVAAEIINCNEGDICDNISSSDNVSQFIESLTSPLDDTVIKTESNSYIKEDANVQYPIINSDIAGNDTTCISVPNPDDETVCDLEIINTTILDTDETTSSTFAATHLLTVPEVDLSEKVPPCQSSSDQEKLIKSGLMITQNNVTNDDPCIEADSYTGNDICNLSIPRIMINGDDCFDDTTQICGTFKSNYPQDESSSLDDDTDLLIKCDKTITREHGDCKDVNGFLIQCDEDNALNQSELNNYECDKNDENYPLGNKECCQNETVNMSSTSDVDTFSNDNQLNIELQSPNNLCKTEDGTYEKNKTKLCIKVASKTNVGDKIRQAIDDYAKSTEEAQSNASIEKYIDTINVDIMAKKVSKTSETKTCINDSQRSSSSKTDIEIYEKENNESAITVANTTNVADKIRQAIDDYTKSTEETQSDQAIEKYVDTVNVNMVTNKVKNIQCKMYDDNGMLILYCNEDGNDEYFNERDDNDQQVVPHLGGADPSIVNMKENTFNRDVSDEDIHIDVMCKNADKLNNMEKSAQNAPVTEELKTGIKRYVDMKAESDIFEETSQADLRNDAPIADKMDSFENTHTRIKATRGPTNAISNDSSDKIFKRLNECTIEDDYNSIVDSADDAIAKAEKALRRVNRIIKQAELNQDVKKAKTRISDFGLEIKSDSPIENKEYFNTLEPPVADVLEMNNKKFKSTSQEKIIANENVISDKTYDHTPLKYKEKENIDDCTQQAYHGPDNDFPLDSNKRENNGDKRNEQSHLEKETTTKSFERLPPPDETSIQSVNILITEYTKKESERDQIIYRGVGLEDKLVKKSSQTLYHKNFMETFEKDDTGNKSMCDKKIGDKCSKHLVCKNAKVDTIKYKDDVKKSTQHRLPENYTKTQPCTESENVHDYNIQNEVPITKSKVSFQDQQIPHAKIIANDLSLKELANNKKKEDKPIEHNKQIKLDEGLADQETHKPRVTFTDVELKEDEVNINETNKNNKKLLQKSTTTAYTPHSSISDGVTKETNEISKKTISSVENFDSTYDVIRCRDACLQATKIKAKRFSSPVSDAIDNIYKNKNEEKHDFSTSNITDNCNKLGTAESIVYKEAQQLINRARTRQSFTTCAYDKTFETNELSSDNTRPFKEYIVDNNEINLKTNKNDIVMKNNSTLGFKNIRRLYDNEVIRDVSPHKNLTVNEKVATYFAKSTKRVQDSSLDMVRKECISELKNSNLFLEQKSNIKSNDDSDESDTDDNITDTHNIPEKVPEIMCSNLQSSDSIENYESCSNTDEQMTENERQTTVDLKFNIKSKKVNTDGANNAIFPISTFANKIRNQYHPINTEYIKSKNLGMGTNSERFNIGDSGDTQDSDQQNAYILFNDTKNITEKFDLQFNETEEFDGNEQYILNHGKESSYLNDNNAKTQKFYKKSQNLFIIDDGESFFNKQFDFQHDDTINVGEDNTRFLSIPEEHGSVQTKYNKYGYYNEPNNNPDLIEETCLRECQQSLSHQQKLSQYVEDSMSEPFQGRTLPVEGHKRYFSLDELTTDTQNSLKNNDRSALQMFCDNSGDIPEDTVNITWHLTAEDFCQCIGQDKKEKIALSTNTDETKFDDSKIKQKSKVKKPDTKVSKSKKKNVELQINDATLPTYIKEKRPIKTDKNDQCDSVERGDDMVIVEQSNDLSDENSDKKHKKNKKVKRLKRESDADKEDRMTVKKIKKSKDVDEKLSNESKHKKEKSSKSSHNKHKKPTVELNQDVQINQTENTILPADYKILAEELTPFKKVTVLGDDQSVRDDKARDSQQDSAIYVDQSDKFTMEVSDYGDKSSEINASSNVVEEKSDDYNEMISLWESGEIIPENNDTYEKVENNEKDVKYDIPKKNHVSNITENIREETLLHYENNDDDDNASNDSETNRERELYESMYRSINIDDESEKRVPTREPLRNETSSFTKRGIFSFIGLHMNPFRNL